MSYEVMQKLEDVDGFFDTVNRGKDPAEAEAAEKVYNDYLQERATCPDDPEEYTRQAAACIPNQEISAKTIREETRYHRRSRVRAFWRQVAEPAIGYIALGGVMVAAMVKGIVPAYIAIPVFSLCFIWTAIRADRFLREV